MKIVIISGSAPPEPICAGRVHWDMAKYLAEEGHEAWLISPFPSRPLGTKYKNSYRDRVVQPAENFYHVNVKSFTYPKYNLLYRSYESLDFGIKAIRYVNRKIEGCDVIYASPWAFLGQLMIVLFRKNKKVPLIMNVQDLYPESLLSKINSRWIVNLLKPLYSIDKLIVKRSTHLTVISEKLRGVYQDIRKMPENKITVLHNWQDESEFVESIDTKGKILDRYNLNNINDKFIFMYLGNIGPVAGIETIINSFAELNKNNSVLIIAGSGSYKERCQLLVNKLNNSNIFFLDVPPGLKPVVELQSISDILLLPILPDAAHSSIPSKLIAYMFSGKPVITSANINSETATAIKESGCGWITKSNNISEWIRLMNLARETDKRTLKIMGNLGLKYAIKNYSKKEGQKKFKELLYKIIN